MEQISEVEPQTATQMTDRKAELEIQKLEADIEKAKADRRKAELDIKQLTLWYRNPSILQPIAAILVATLAAIIGTGNGWFSTKLESLKNQQDKVQREIDLLNAGKTTLHRDLDGLKTERDDLTKRLAETGAVAERLSKEIADLRKKAFAVDKYRLQLAILESKLRQVGADAREATEQILYGKIVDSSGIAIANATVWLDERGQSNSRLEFSTGPDGFFKIRLAQRYFIFSHTLIVLTSDGRVSEIFFKPIPSKLQTIEMGPFRAIVK
jgi:DNA repair exonuclease SbcCD ATPase subunit